MNRAERLSAVLDLLAESGQVEVDQIVERLDVSPATARRDLDALAEPAAAHPHPRRCGRALGRLRPADPLQEPAEPRGEGGHRPGGERARAARRRDRALRRHHGDGDRRRLLMSRADIMEPSPEPSLTVVTNAINIAMQLAMRPQIKTVVTGRCRARALVRARRRVHRRGARQHHPRPRVHRRERHRPDRRPDLARRARGGGQRAHGIARRARGARRRLVEDRQARVRRDRRGAGCSRRSSPTTASTREQRARLADSGYDVIVAE